MISPLTQQVTLAPRSLITASALMGPIKGSNLQEQSEIKPVVARCTAAPHVSAGETEHLSVTVSPAQMLSMLRVSVVTDMHRSPDAAAPPDDVIVQ